MSTLCGCSLWFAMPSGSGDAPGWIVLRDRQGTIRGVSDLAMVQMHEADGVDAQRQGDRVSVPLTVEFRHLPAASSFRRWQALLCPTPTDDEFHGDREAPAHRRLFERDRSGISSSLLDGIGNEIPWTTDSFGRSPRSS